MAVKYRGREFSEEEISEVREIISAHPDKSRRFISQEVCRRWNWRQPNGTLKDVVCRGLLLHLARHRHIELPPVRQEPHQVSHSKRPEIIAVDSTPIESELSVLKPVELRQVSRTSLQNLYKSLIDQYHYLGYTRPVGEHLEYLAFAGGRVIACIGWCSAPRHIGSRDRHIGWNKEQRQQRLQHVIINTRFLILPWIRVAHLASHLLGLTARRLCRDWQEVYNHDVIWLETFVDPERGFTGACYKAANWRYLGMTTGRGKADQTKKPTRSLKYVFGYPLRKDFREALCNGIL